MSSTIIPIQKRGARSRALKIRHRAKDKPAMREVYDPGSTALLLAAFHLRALARLEFFCDENSEDGIFLSQLALDLRKIADGGPFRCTAVRRAFAAQYPALLRSARLAPPCRRSVN
jgi:hypothetical protein